jgi:hypothetical protein
MIVRLPRTISSDDSGKEKNTIENQAAGSNDNCRCKETSKMTPRELIKLMMTDLAFWKKKTKE